MDVPRGPDIYTPPGDVIQEDLGFPTMRPDGPEPDKVMNCLKQALDAFNDNEPRESVAILKDIFGDVYEGRRVLHYAMQCLDNINNEPFKNFVLNFLRKNNYIASRATSYPQKSLLLSSLETMHKRLLVLEKKQKK